MLAILARLSAAICLHLLQVDYLIGCHYDNISGQLLLVAGTNAGAAAFFPIAEQQHRAGEL